MFTVYRITPWALMNSKRQCNSISVRNKCFADSSILGCYPVQQKDYFVTSREICPPYIQVMKSSSSRSL